MSLEWQLDLEAILDRYEVPTHRGVLAPAKLGRATNPRCGDEITLFVQLQDGMIARALWDGHGCTISQAAADVVAELADGSHVSDARRLTLADVLGRIGSVRTRLDCAALGLTGLQRALETE